MECAGYPYKIWKTRPPGKEQLELNRLFEVGEISESTTADFVRQKWPIFQKFTPRVFATHFRTTKAKYDWDSKMNAAQNIDRKPISITHVRSNCSVLFENPPFITWMYADHEAKLDFVVVAMSVISGTSDFKFNLSDDGVSVTVTYSWPIAFCTPDLLFKDLPKTHPKVHALKSHLLQDGITEKSNPPRGSIIIKLPCKVQREISEFKNCFVQSNDTTLIMMEFVACHTYFYLNHFDSC